MNNEVAILLMSHGGFAKAAMESAEMVFGRQENYETLSVYLADQVDALRQEMLDKVERLDTSKGLLVFTDIVGGNAHESGGQSFGAGEYDGVFWT